ncbi:MAG: hypothetical protein HZB17_07120 [Chloroflexi bacterium]|nr:hypothetical protein [Chloroflexota bacterium]
MNCSLFTVHSSFFIVHSSSIILHTFMIKLVAFDLDGTLLDETLTFFILP